MLAAPQDTLPLNAERPSMCSALDSLLLLESRIGPAGQPQTLQPGPPGRAFCDTNSREKFCEG
jgi:hypothetical protein